VSTLEYDAGVEPRDVVVRLEVGQGETVALLGPNGAGKSTVLSVIAGLVAPTYGRVRVGGRDLVSPQRAAVPPHRRNVALLAQEALLFPHLTVLENVAFGPRAHRVSRDAAHATAQQWLERVGVDDLAARRPHELSGGQAQRVAVVPRSEPANVIVAPNSPSERANARTAPLSNPGRTRGSVTRRNTVLGEAPRVAATTS
jgi:molybdate transport system ATP-binding protein